MAEYVSLTAFVVITVAAGVSSQMEKMAGLYSESANALGGGNGGTGGVCADGSCKCFVAGTPIDTAEGPKSIETVALGDRVGPESAECANLRIDHWQEVDLRIAASGPAGVDDVVIHLLRPQEWLAENSVSLGSKVPVNLEELNIQGGALVTSVGAGPALKPGTRCPVTGFVRHVSPEVITVSLQGGTAP